jgi:hypothetical protein
MASHFQTSLADQFERSHPQGDHNLLPPHPFLPTATWSALLTTSGATPSGGVLQSHCGASFDSAIVLASGCCQGRISWGVEGMHDPPEFNKVFLGLG